MLVEALHPNSNPYYFFSNRSS